MEEIGDYMRKIRMNDDSQFIVLMGIILAISVFIMASMAAEITNVNTVALGHPSSLLNEFGNIKETFGTTLNYNLINVTITANESIMKGDINKLSAAFNQTKEEYFDLEIKYGFIFDACLNRYWYSSEEVIPWKGGPSGSDINRTFYNVDISLFLDDGESQITTNVQYLLLCNPDV